MTKLVFSSLEGMEQNFAILDLIPDTHAWVKNVAGAFIYGNRLFFERFGFTSLQGLLGHCDFDLAPAHLAEKYTRDDALVLRGKQVRDRLELIGGADQRADWFLTSKWPVYDPVDKIIGTFGISRHLNRTEDTTVPFLQLRAPIDYINQHFTEAISIKALASASNLSVSALERRFRKHLDKTPQQYLNEVRLDRARQVLLETDKSIGTIALEMGFADHSHFTRCFTRHFGMTPKNARRDRAANQASGS